MTEAVRQDGGRARRGADTRREILAVARRMFGQRGYARTSMSDIAAEVGVVEGALYKHFPGKRELLLEAARAHLEPRFEATRMQLDGVQGTRNRLRFVIWCQLREFIDEPGICRLVIQEMRPFDDQRDSGLRELLRRHTELVTRVIEAAQEVGELRPGLQPAVVRDVVYGGIEHLAYRVLHGRGTIDADILADQVTDLVLRGIALPGAVETPGHATEATDTAVAETARLRCQVDRLTALVEALHTRLSEQG